MKTILILAALLQADDPRKAEVVSRLNTQRVTLDFNAAPLDDVVAFLREFTAINFMIDPDVRTKLGEDELKVTFKAKDVRLGAALKLMGLGAARREGVIVLGARAAEAPVVTRVYDVRDLGVRLTDFPGPRVDLRMNEPIPIVSCTFCFAEPEPRFRDEMLVELVRACTGDRSWDENPRADLHLANGMLFVAQTARTHAEVARLLDRLRAVK